MDWENSPTDAEVAPGRGAQGFECVCSSSSGVVSAFTFRHFFSGVRPSSGPSSAAETAHGLPLQKFSRALHMRKWLRPRTVALRRTATSCICKRHAREITRSLYNWRNVQPAAARRVVSSCGTTTYKGLDPSKPRSKVRTRKCTGLEHTNFTNFHESIHPAKKKSNSSN